MILSEEENIHSEKVSSTTVASVCLPTEIEKNLIHNEKFPKCSKNSIENASESSSKSLSFGMDRILHSESAKCMESKEEDETSNQSQSPKNDFAENDRSSECSACFHHPLRASTDLFSPLLIGPHSQSLGSFVTHNNVTTSTAHPFFKTHTPSSPLSSGNLLKPAVMHGINSSTINSSVPPAPWITPSFHHFSTLASQHGYSSSFPSIASYPGSLMSISGNSSSNSRDVIGNTDSLGQGISHHHNASSSSRRKRSWSRAVFSNLQRKGLEKRFQLQKYITKPDRRQLAATLGLTDAQVKVWFQNRRMKWRHSKEGKVSSGTGDESLILAQPCISSTSSNK